MGLMRTNIRTTIALSATLLVLGACGNGVTPSEAVSPTDVLAVTTVAIATTVDPTSSLPPDTTVVPSTTLAPPTTLAPTTTTKAPTTTTKAPSTTAAPTDTRTPAEIASAFAASMASIQDNALETGITVARQKLNASWAKYKDLGAKLSWWDSELSPSSGTSAEFANNYRFELQGQTFCYRNTATAANNFKTVYVQASC